MKKLLSLAAALALCASALAGCGHTHTWNEATCTAPKTCAECGETEGEVLAHQFGEATCAAAAACSVCGETKGEPLAHQFGEATCETAAACSVCGETDGDPLPHQLSEATYQSAAVCSVCGTAEGEPLTPDYVACGIEVDLHKVGDTADYTTSSALDANLDITGTTTLTSYDIVPSFEEIGAREGYECRVAVFTTEFGADALANGANVACFMGDYYDIDLFAGNADHSDPVYSVTFANIDGEDQAVYMSQRGGFEVQGDSLVFTLTVCAQVPVGYDGIVGGLVRNGACETMGYINEGYVPENFVLFRMGN